MATAERNQAAVRACLEGVSHEHSDALERVLAPDYVLHDPALPGDVRGAGELRALLDEYRKALEDVRLEVEHQFTDGDDVATRWSVRGTHSGDLLGVSPSGAEVTFTGVTISRCRDGRIVEEWEICDTLGLLQQIGALPATTP